MAHTVPVRVKGIYRALDRSAPDASWANLLPEILPQGADPPPPARLVLMSPTELYSLAKKLSSTRTFTSNGRVFHIGAGVPLGSIAELAISPQGLTLERARRLAGQFDAFRRTLPTSTLGRMLGCAGPVRIEVSTGATSGPRCPVSSSLSSAVALANQSASQISAGVTLLAGAGTAIALAVAGAAGVFLVRRRSAEVALLFARGENVLAFGGRTCLELLLPTAVGAAAGFAFALALTGVFAPSGSIDNGTLGSAIAHAGFAALAGLLLAAAAAAFLFVRQFDSGTRRGRWLRFIPWELPLLVVAAPVSCTRSRRAAASRAAARTPRATRRWPCSCFRCSWSPPSPGCSPGLSGVRFAPGPGRGTDLPIAPSFALRRLAAARELLTRTARRSLPSHSARTSAAEALAASLSHNVSEKAYVAYGGDVQGLGSDSTSLPRSFPYPLTRLDYANQSATIGGTNGTEADVMAVDPATLGSVIHWYPDWGTDPRPSFGKLATTSTAPSARDRLQHGVPDGGPGDLDPGGAGADPGRREGRGVPGDDARRSARRGQPRGDQRVRAEAPSLRPAR